METQKKISANDITRGVVFCSITIFGVIWMFFGEVSQLYRIMMPVFAVVSLFALARQLACPVFLTQEGVQCYRFGRQTHMLEWKDIKEICVMHDFSLSKNSATKRIVIVPKECETFGSEKQTEQRYLSRFRHQIVVTDDTRKNRDFINQYYGEIVIYQ